MAIGSDELINRFGYHRANADSAPKHAKVRNLMLYAASALDELLPDGRDKSLAFTSLQETMHWANSAIAMQNEVDTETAHLPNIPSNAANCRACAESGVGVCEEHLDEARE